MVTLGNLTSLLLSSRVQPDDSVTEQHAAHSHSRFFRSTSLRLTLSCCVVLCCVVWCCVWVRYQITRCLYTQFKKIGLHTALSKLSEIFDHDHFALVVTSQRCFDKGGAVSEKLVVFGIVTRIDLLNFIVTNRPRGASVSSEAAEHTSDSTAATVAPPSAQFVHEHKEPASQQDEKKEASSVYSIERM